MADIQPKNTNTIRVDVIKEKAPSAGITLDNTVKVDTITEKTGGSRTSFSGGIKTDTILEATATTGIAMQAVLRILAGVANVIKPLVATLDIGTTTLAEHIANLYVKNILANGSNLKVGTVGNNELQLQSDGVVRLALIRSGVFHHLTKRIDHVGYTSGGEIRENTAAAFSVSTSPVALTTFDVAANSQVMIRVDLLSRNSSTGAQSYLEVAIPADRVGAAAVTGGAVTTLHTVGAALHTITTTLGATSIQINIQNVAGTNTIFGLACSRIIPLSTNA